ncbi:transporter associated domain-containing protein [Sulfuriferula plumbiphila]
MRPFNEVVALSANHSLVGNLELITRHRFSRYPYLDQNDKVKGVIHLKNLFLAEHKEGSIEDLEKFIRPVQQVSPEMSALELFRRFRKGEPHFAVIGHTDSPPLGFITLDNMLSALVGEIRDEFRHSHNDWTKLDDGTLIGKGSLPIFTLERALGIDIDNDQVDSVGGLIMWKLGDLPKEGDKIEFEHFDVVVKKMSGPRIVLVRVHQKAMAEPGEQ